MKASSYYSASTQGFYTRKDNGKDIPADAVEISDEHRLDLLESESKGMRISVNLSGQPVAAPRGIPSKDDQNKMLAQKRRAAYREESDELYLQEKRQEVPKGTWLAKVEAIKLRFQFVKI